MLNISQKKIFCLKDVSIGKLLVAKTLKGICYTALGDTTEQLLQEFTVRFGDDVQQVMGDNAFKKEVAHIIAMIETPKLAKKYNFPLDINGTVFQRQVWTRLCDIPCGETISYEELACRVGMPNAIRAVANACARNELAIIIPCHRVVRKNGFISGYRWGVERKQILLQREQTEEIKNKLNFV
ncbi:methylated-DNA--[protein]-cysteine S-methyltransferase [Bartonella krasnovii]|uniref:Methylated-DNA--[protein]-cysteine S-methyltransferase n=1 Tax=Bartonella krasnovii TaxID=2267275 RepID=A0ABY3VW13_9HYPH|nr:methylated-DNA--[protein]-cysteine S-methyltransferase [Bartonella krasnovii]UNF29539.1 methylated-DNA--[protein]-cysteine S-methyltransferase [Bartonella krasnovii]UNF35897.1 methylated-DNA--[protein]-cysteine S-methyltransferase [Bartonella krasnovii]UNF39301.1 methylated-DNA--[protein]-cysteine S-methyltransferase [Bartonella krasnovii]UNF44312.1 methylated-DNA--[protein]-cysteine S-methyltransferase [Bartonella krasnovii]UNF45839.1 methylated-DNA--[protein]-cysteine S-methyltransferase 